MAGVRVDVCVIDGIPIPGFLGSEGNRPEAPKVEVRTTSGTEKHRSGYRVAPDTVLIFERQDANKAYFDDWERLSRQKVTPRNIVIYHTDSTGLVENHTDRTVHEGAELTLHDVGGEDWNTAERPEKTLRVELAVKKTYELSRGAAAV